MRIIIDATTLLLRSAGVKNYIHYWLASLQQVALPQSESVVTYPPGIPVGMPVAHERSAMGRVETFFRLRLVEFANIRRNPVLNQLYGNADVFHCSQHTANPPKRPALTATVFDLSCWTKPQYHTQANVFATKRYGNNILQKSDGLIAISEHAKRDAVEILRIPETRIRVIYPGIAEAFFDVSLEESAKVGARYHLDRPYFLFVGCIEPRKNVARLIEAYRLLPEHLRQMVHLVIAGPLGWADERTKRLVVSSPDVRYLGYVPERDLPGLFGGAATFVYPSHYEGFGLPVAQAMAAGTPVVTSNCSSLPEILGGDGLLVNPDSAVDLAGALEQTLNNASATEALVRSARKRADRFRWSFSAAESLRFFHDVSGR